MKKNIIIILMLIVNIGIAFAITNLLGITNIVLFQSMTALNYTITYEIIIWFVLSLIEAGIYELIKMKNKKDEAI